MLLATHSQSSSTCKEHVSGHFLKAYNFADLTWIVTPTVTRQWDAHDIAQISATQSQSEADLHVEARSGPGE